METLDSTIFARLGIDLIAQAMRLFYDRAFEDPLIQHFFMNSNKEDLIATQITFASALLGGPRAYQGKPLLKAHEGFSIRTPHFRRRQVLMGEVLDLLAVNESDKRAWLALEESLRPLVMRVGHGNCQVPAHLQGK